MSKETAKQLAPAGSIDWTPYRAPAAAVKRVPLLPYDLVPRLGLDYDFGADDSFRIDAGADVGSFARWMANRRTVGQSSYCDDGPTQGEACIDVVLDAYNATVPDRTSDRAFAGRLAVCVMRKGRAERRLGEPEPVAAFDAALLTSGPVAVELLDAVLNWLGSIEVSGAAGHAGHAEHNADSPCESARLRGATENRQSRFRLGSAETDARFVFGDPAYCEELVARAGNYEHQYLMECIAKNPA